MNEPILKIIDRNQVFTKLWNAPTFPMLFEMVFRPNSKTLHLYECSSCLSYVDVQLKKSVREIQIAFESLTQIIGPQRNDVVQFTMQ